MYFGSMNVDLSNLKRAAVGGPFWCAILALLVGVHRLCFL